MIERILVPLDGSMNAEAILPQVRRLLYRNDSEVLLVYAVVPPTSENALLGAEPALTPAREYLVSKKESLEKAGVRVRAIVRIGSPVGVILDVVEEEKATLIAMATHGSSGFTRMLLGSVAEGILRRSPVPVLVLRPFWSYELVPRGGIEHRPIRNILLTVDGSDRSAMAIPGVLQLAELFEARILLMRVLETRKGKPATQEECEEAEAQLKELASMIEKKGVETLRLLEDGDPVEKILQAVKNQEVDLLALTTHGRGGVSRAIMGSVTEKVLRQAPIPLLVTRNATVETVDKGVKAAGKHEMNMKG
ncbi:MAG TPA: universal stress protein [Planctomycetota bacterium]|nr:universal stress protein [Planctomycetota bacterium]